MVCHAGSDFTFNPGVKCFKTHVTSILTLILGYGITG